MLSLYLLSILTVREKAAFLSAWLFHSAPYVTVALTLQSDPSGHPQLSHVPAADKSRSCDSEGHILQIPGRDSWKSFCDHKWTGEPASFHRTSDIPTVAGRSKHLSPSWGGPPSRGQCPPASTSRRPLMPKRMQLTQAGVQTAPLSNRTQNSLSLS